jgi:Cys-tRNA(Pro)/Cys-tRNA(Cys) deacylase
MEKTNVMRLLDQKRISYRSYYYGDTDAISGVDVATVLQQDACQVFKTLVTVSSSKKYYVFMIPVAEELDLKKAAKSVGEKAVSMLPAKELLPLTGYVHGGCSPFGMKKKFPVVVHESAKNFSSIIFSAGKVGYQVEVSVSDLEESLDCQFAFLVEER